MDKDTIWSNILDKIKSELDSLAYQTWFQDTELYKIENGIAMIIVPYEINKKIIINNYKDLVDNCFREITGNVYELELLLQEEAEVTPSIVETVKNDREEEVVYEISSNLLSKYTFDNFVVGNSNKFAHAAALAVAESPGKIYNPLFIYGNSGLGKTHLMHAIGNYIVSHSNKKVLYITSEQFINDYVAMQKKESDGTNFNYVDFFKHKYRNVDVLIIDDIQYLSGAVGTQREFFHTFNTLYEGNKQIIISSDSSPNDLAKLEDRLKTRFGWGLAVDIYPPDIELRSEILKKKFKELTSINNVPEDVIEYMASTINGSIRNLEGAVTRLAAYSATFKVELNLKTAEEALVDFINKGFVSEKNDIARIQKIVADYFQVTVDDLRSKKRSANLAFPRQVAMYLCRQLTDESFPKIGIEFGGKDHSTVIHSCDKIEKEMKKNKELEKTIEKLTKEIR
ncbi:MAG: chromosomal replication initiator protein DnaA [Bacilli bacterium]|nr:chromosomal replication initiator protein DnaA [Bacilli bacterium]